MSKHTNLLTIDIYEKIEEFIGRNSLNPHDRLPSERTLSELWGVNRLTLREAIEKLVNEGKLYSRHGKGTFVAEPKYLEDISCFISFTAGWQADGHAVSSRKLSLKRIKSGRTLSKSLSIPSGSEVYELKRIRSLNGSPLSIETAYLPAVICSGLEQFDFEHGSLYETLEKQYGIKPARQRQVANLAVLTKKESENLEAKEGDAAFYITGIMTDAEGTPVEYSTAVIRADRYALQKHLSAGE
jgi:GntR family transcriptional regulator